MAGQLYDNLHRFQWPGAVLGTLPLFLSPILRKVSIQWHVQKSIQKLTDPICEATGAAKAPTARHITRSYTIKQCHVHYCVSSLQTMT